METIEKKCCDEIARLETEINKIYAKIKPDQQNISSLQADLYEAKQKLAAIRKAPRVSDHAVIRYLERVHGFDFETERNNLLTKEVEAAIKAGAKSVKRDGFKLIIKDNTIVTVVN